MRWRRAVGADLPELAAFLKDGEERRVGFTGRLLREAKAELRLPSPLRGAVWLARPDAGSAGAVPAGAGSAGAQGPILGAVLCHPSRLAFPVFPRSGVEYDRRFALLASSFSPASAIGLSGDVERYEAALRLSPRASVEYRLMAAAAAPPMRAPCAAAPDILVRRASASDLEALLPLQEAYEIEEVLTPIHRFNGSACKASLARALERQLVYVAEEGGVVVGKAGTNARGFCVDQIGGVYTLPSRRNRGVARAMMTSLLSDIAAQGRRTALFVKPGNAAATALYRSLGFEEIGDFRADYFEA
jgi:ribosomal protein S18 acetylase RimI-like enzyme